MSPDPKWLEILKASGWQTAAIAAACGVFLMLPQWRLIPTPAPWVVLAVTFGFLVTGFLTVASVISGFFRFVPIHHWIVEAINSFRSARAIRDYIPHMTPDERQIIAYLLAHNQKMFTADQDGGHATTLLSRGIVVMAVRPGQIFAADDTPMAIPDSVWKVLVKHKADFPITDNALNGPHPWRVNWMERF